MKMKTPLLAVLSMAAMSIGSAFTLDAIGYSGGVLEQNPYSVFVPGYGELVFEAAPGSSLVVSSAYQNGNGFGTPSLSFDENETVKIAFVAAEPQNVDFVGQSAGGSFVSEKDLFTPQAFLVSLKGGGDGAGLHAVSWNTEYVPEPTSSMLGLLGGMALLLCRRR